MMKKLTKSQTAEIEQLTNLNDDEIDTTDIPELTSA